MTRPEHHASRPSSPNWGITYRAQQRSAPGLCPAAGRDWCRSWCPGGEATRSANSKYKRRNHQRLCDRVTALAGQESR